MNVFNKLFNAPSYLHWSYNGHGDSFFSSTDDKDTCSLLKTEAAYLVPHSVSCSTIITYNNCRLLSPSVLCLNIIFGVLSIEVF